MNPLRKLILSIGLSLLCAFSLGAAEDGLIDSPMYRLPVVDGPRTIIEYLPAKELWLKAIQRPEVEMKVAAAQAISQAHQKGVKGLDEMIPPLLEAFSQKEAHPAVRLATARALIDLDAKSTAEKLFEIAQSSDRQLREIIEPALAKWDYRPARAVWLTRLKVEKPPSTERAAAIRLLTTVKEKEAIAPLQQLVSPKNPDAMVRLEAAQSLGILQTEGLEDQAQSYLKDATRRGLTDRLVAVKLVQNHRSEKAAKLLLELLRDPEPAVAKLAAQSLLTHHLKTLSPLVDFLIAHRDEGVRKISVEAIRRDPVIAKLDRLIEHLGDEHVEVRTEARKALIELAKEPTFKEKILAGGMKSLESSDWKSLEQATILLTLLDHKPAANGLVKLLPHPRPEVLLSAAWGLRKLNVPETLPGVLQYVVTRMPLQKSAEPPKALYEWYDHQLSQLNQFLGQQRYAPADATLRKFMDPIKSSTESRCAAIWALGMIHEGKPVAEIADKLDERIKASKTPIPTEEAVIARMAAIALGRMKDKQHLNLLRIYYSPQAPSFDLFSNACGWAIEQITGEKVPPPGESHVTRREGFLIPIKE